MIGLLLPIEKVATRDHQAQSRSAGRLGRAGILAMGGRTTNLGASGDERHMLLMFHDCMTWSRGRIFSPWEEPRTPHLGERLKTRANFGKVRPQRARSYRAPVDGR